MGPCAPSSDSALGARRRGPGLALRRSSPARPRRVPAPGPSRPPLDAGSPHLRRALERRREFLEPGRAPPRPSFGPTTPGGAWAWVGVGPGSVGAAAVRPRLAPRHRRGPRRVATPGRHSRFPPAPRAPRRRADSSRAPTFTRTRTPRPRHSAPSVPEPQLTPAASLDRDFASAPSDLPKNLLRRSLWAPKAARFLFAPDSAPPLRSPTPLLEGLPPGRAARVLESF